MSNKDTDQSLKQDSRLIRREYFKALFPVMFSVLGATINALIDSVFVSLRLGENALAAVNLSMPVYLVLCTFGALISGGASVCSAREAGRNNMDKAQEYYRSAFILSAAVSLLFTLAGTIFCRQISGVLSGGGELIEEVNSYCFVTFLGSFVCVFMYLPLSYLQLEGKNRAISASVIIMIAADTALDILFLFVLDLGLYGASAASVLSTLAAALYGFIALSSGESNYRTGRQKPDKDRLAKIIRFGSPSALGNLFDAVKLLTLNIIIIAALGEKGAVVWAVLNTLSELSLTIVSGIPRAAAPMIGAYYTAKENGGIRMLTRIEILTGLAFSVLFAVLLAVTHIPTEALFGISSSILLPGICLGTSIVLSTVCSIWEKHFNAIGMITEANIVSVSRSCVFPIAAAVFLAVTGGYIWLFLPLSAFLTVLVIAALTAAEYLRSKKSGKALSPVLLLNDSLEREHKVLDFSLAANMDEVCDAADKLQDFCSENDMDSMMTMKMGLAIEELLNVIIQKMPGLISIDLRAFALGGSTGVRLRFTGKKYDPFTDKESDDDFLMGINMINKLADTTTHVYFFGMNHLTIIFPDSQHAK